MAEHMNFSPIFMNLVRLVYSDLQLQMLYNGLLIIYHTDNHVCLKYS